MDPTPNPDRKNPSEMIHDPASGAGGFLAVGRSSLWFTPPHIMAMIRPEERTFLFANPPYGSPIGIR